MVHALRRAHSLLHPSGLLINIADLPIPHVIEVHSAEAVIKAGWMMDSVDFRDERAALNALSQIVSEGYFQLEDEQDFGFNQHFDDVHELKQELAEGWESAVLPDKTIQRLEDIIGQAGQLAKVVLKTPARMTSMTVG
jgi:hypothetical protein